MHAAVVAKALDVPVLAQVPAALARIDSNDMVVLDAMSGHAIVRPSEDILDLYAARAEARTKQKATYAANRDLPAVTHGRQNEDHGKDQQYDKSFFHPAGCGFAIIDASSPRDSFLGLTALSCSRYWLASAYLPCLARAWMMN